MDPSSPQAQAVAKPRLRARCVCERRWPRRALSSRTPTSRCRSATAGRRVRARESPPGAGHTATGTRVALRNLVLAFPRASTRGLDRICRPHRARARRRARLTPGLAGSVRSMPCCPTQVCRAARHCLAARRRASLGHLDLATYPSAGMLDRPTRSWVLRSSRLEEVEDVLRARCRPKSKEMVIRVGEGPAAADRHEARVSDLREDHGCNLQHSHPTRQSRADARDQIRPRAPAW